jgi:hypothetical protein
MNNEQPPNIVPQLEITQLERRYFHSYEKNYISAIRNHVDFVCRSKISDVYIHYAFNHFKHGIAYYNTDNEIIGVALWKIRQHMTKGTNEMTKTMYIYLICGIEADYKFGNIIFPELESYCVNHRIGSIHLESLNEPLVHYYEKYGFNLHPQYGKPLYMEKDILLPIITRKIGNKTRKVKTFSK